ncbi:hypothetical protein [Vibrio splendidus]|uniref:hypothetical protein n=1 Tax=Vibrio splendidus TaxID=29497 RepID=UPI000D3318D6|nr:hypothetical protein [Vibrio splendidus]PTP67775.1 hypothetical protein CWO31_04920 [Vibrio splendidus]
MSICQLPFMQQRLVTLSQASLKLKFDKELKVQGFVLDSEFAIAEAVESVVVGEITQNHLVPVADGSSVETTKCVNEASGDGLKTRECTDFIV